MVHGSSGLSARQNAIPVNWRKQTYRIRATGKQLFLPVVNNRNPVSHEVKNHGVAEVKKKKSHDRPK